MVIVLQFCKYNKIAGFKVNSIICDNEVKLLLENHVRSCSGLVIGFSLALVNRRENVLWPRL